MQALKAMVDVTAVATKWSLGGRDPRSIVAMLEEMRAFAIEATDVAERPGILALREI